MEMARSDKHASLVNCDVYYPRRKVETTYTLV